VTLPYVAWRLLQLVPTILGIVLVGFVLIHAAPGDPILAIAGEHGDAAYYAAMRERFGLDQSPPRQLASYAARVASGDFGVSYVHGRPVAALVLERAPATLLLTGTALLLAILLAVPLGIYAARRPHGARDLLVNAAALGVYSAPVFWVGQLAILLLAFRFGLFPVHGMTTAGSDATGLAAAGDVLRHLALPALVLASQEVATLARLTRSGLLEELEMDHVRTARAKGLGERAVLLRHALPRALIPVLTVIGARTGHLVAGAAVVEIVFGWPGIGRLLLTALQTRDAPVLLGLFFLVSLTVVIANLLTDLAHAAVDPRVRFR
jgi:peptide/nickel transport system permease protein